MSSEAFDLSMAISGDIYTDFCMRTSWRFDGEDYELQDSDEGEPFVLLRKRDGKRFEVSLVAEVDAP